MPASARLGSPDERAVQRDRELRMRALLISLLLLAAAPGPRPAASQDRPSAAALLIEQPVRIDGELTEAAWSSVEWAGDFVQRQPRTGAPSSESTEFAILYTEETLFVGLRANDREPSKIVSKEMERDSDLFQDDSILLLFDTFNDGRNAYLFVTNPNGARTDALLTDEGRDVNWAWDGVWHVAARRTGQGWVAEIGIPVSTLRFDPLGEQWGLNVQRMIRRRNEETHWAPLPLEASINSDLTQYGQIAVYRVSLAGELNGLRGLRPSRQLDIKPYTVGGRNEDRVRGNSSDNFDGGLDLKWGLTRSLVLDLTYNTDFAEVEVDDQQVNLTRFSLFFPEKRDFFLENAGVFDFGPRPRVSWGEVLMKPFFSRRIGLEGGRTVPIDFGARLTGRAGGWNIGALGISTARLAPGADGEPAVPGVTYGVARVTKNIGERSTVGGILTMRDREGSTGERLYGLDFDLKPTQRTEFSGFWAESDPGPGVGEEERNETRGAGLSYQGPELTASADYVEVQPDFDPVVGFLLRRDFRMFHPRLEWRPRIEKWGLLSWWSDFGVQRFERSSDGRLESQSISVSPVGLATKSGEFLWFGPRWTREQLFEPFEISPGIVVPVGLYENRGYAGGVSTSGKRAVWYDNLTFRGGFFDGDWLTTSNSVTFRLSRRLQTSTAWTYTDVSLSAGGFSFDQFRQRINVAWTPNIRVNLLAQYNTADELLGLNARFHWIYRPGSDLFVVYNENWTAPTIGRRQPLSRQVIVKFNYLLQR